MTFGTFSSAWVALSIDLMFSLMLKIIPCIIKLIVAFLIPLKPFWIESWFIWISRRCEGLCLVFFRRCGWFLVLRRKVRLFPCPPLRMDLRFWPLPLQISPGFDFIFLSDFCFWFSFGYVSEAFIIISSAVADRLLISNFILLPIRVFCSTVLSMSRNLFRVSLPCCRKVRAFGFRSKFPPTSDHWFLPPCSPLWTDWR